MLQACEVSQFKDVVARLPLGLHTHILEKGVNLSGGQKQRLALARGILAARSSDIVLLDEPTSSIDARTEMKIYNRLFDDFQNKAIISSLHRLHLLQKFDYIYMLHDGSIEDEGTFDHLLHNSPAFKEMWQHQIPVEISEAAEDEDDFPKLNLAL